MLYTSWLNVNDMVKQTLDMPEEKLPVFENFPGNIHLTHCNSWVSFRSLDYEQEGTIAEELGKKLVMKIYTTCKSNSILENL